MESDVLQKPATLASERGQAQASWMGAAVCAILLAASGHLLIKYGLNSAAPLLAGGIGARILHYLAQPAVAAGLAIYGLGTLFWITAVSRRDISFLFPLTALNYVLVSVGGKVFFAENISPGRWLGIGVVVLGVSLLQVSQKGERA